MAVSDASGAVCEHQKTGLIHRARDVDELTQHITILHDDSDFRQRLRKESLNSVSEITWESSGMKLLSCYRQAIKEWNEKLIKTFAI